MKIQIAAINIEWQQQWLNSALINYCSLPISFLMYMGFPMCSMAGG